MDGGQLLLAAFCLPGISVLIAFVLFLFSRCMWPWLFRSTELLSIAGLPIFFLYVTDFEHENDCCNESAFFSPDHRASMYVLIALCTLSYALCTLRKRLAPPLVEVALNCALIIGITLNAVLYFHEEALGIWLMGNAPIVLLFLMRLARNHLLFVAQMNDLQARNPVEQACLGLLRSHAFVKFPVLLVLCLPLLAILAGVMMLFGQRPDALIRAFTDTYKQGLSLLDHECDGVICEGHFLCTVAARGHAALVVPERIGVRHGRTVICNRQLLVSNAFEELIQEGAPRLHRFIRGRYDRVGSFVHRHFIWFDRKWVADVIYLLMKPLEWGFLLVLYVFDRAPENRIASQYLAPQHRQAIRRSD